MTIQLAIPSDLEQRLKSEATRHNESVESTALRLLDQHLPPAAGPTAALALLNQWANEDATLTEAECADNAAVLQALDEDRPSDRKLFPDLDRDRRP